MTDDAWYRERPEPETVWRGVLRRRESVISPGGRNRLSFELGGDDGGRLVIYAPHAEDALDRLVDRTIRIAGKLVDLSGEGYGAELWVSRPEAVDIDSP